jgi:hypothetical protein
VIKRYADIETNTRRVLEQAAGREIVWRRLAITKEQVSERNPTAERKNRQAIQAAQDL